MFCSNCGTQVPDGAERCPGCGRIMGTAKAYTRLGITTGVFAAALYFTGIFNELFMFLLAAYILLFEKDFWLRCSAIKACVLTIFFQFILHGFAMIPDLGDVIRNLGYIFGNNGIDLSILTYMNVIIGRICEIVQTIFFLILG